MFSYLRRPYPFETSFRRRILVSAFVGIFVFLFLLLFRPFGLTNYPDSILKLTLGYGLVSFGFMFFFYMLMLFAFPAYFKEEKWTIGKEIFWLMVMIGLIGIGNAVYTAAAFRGIITLSWRLILIFEVYTLAIGFFPVTLGVVLNQFRLNASFEKTSSEMNFLLNHEVGQEENDNELISIIAENEKDQFTLIKSQLIFIKSADNYVEVFYQSGNKTDRALIRTSLKKCEELLRHLPEFFRCHKSYLVHLDKVIKVNGNAQGYRLQLSNTSESIPVSRAYNETIKIKLANRP